MKDLLVRLLQFRPVLDDGAQPKIAGGYQVALAVASLFVEHVHQFANRGTRVQFDLSERRPASDASTDVEYHRFHSVTMRVPDYIESGYVAAKDNEGLSGHESKSLQGPLSAVGRAVQRDDILESFSLTQQDRLPLVDQDYRGPRIGEVHLIGYEVSAGVHDGQYISGLGIRQLRGFKEHVAGMAKRAVNIAVAIPTSEVHF